MVYCFTELASLPYGIAVQCSGTLPYVNCLDLECFFWRVTNSAESPCQLHKSSSRSCRCCASLLHRPMPGWVGLGGWMWKLITHPSTNPGQCTATPLMCRYRSAKLMITKWLLVMHSLYRQKSLLQSMLSKFLKYYIFCLWVYYHLYGEMYVLHNIPTVTYTIINIITEMRKTLGRYMILEMHR